MFKATRLAIIWTVCTPAAFAAGGDDLPSNRLFVSNQSTVAKNTAPLPLPASATVLNGKAEVIDVNLGGLQSYRDGMAAISRKDFATAAALLKSAAQAFGMGHEKQRAESQYFEAGCRQMVGETTEAANLYRSAIALFDKYDPSSPYRKSAFDQLCNISVSKFKGEKQQKLDAIDMNRSQIRIEQNILLEGSVSDIDAALKAKLSLDKKTIASYVHRGFLQMTCIETAELGSNTTNAANRWMPLLVSGKNAAFFFAPGSFPYIKVRINGQQYVIKVDLQNAQPGLRRFILLTNFEKICALDLDSNESWLLKMQCEKDGSVNSFGWKKLTHKKIKTY